MAETRASAAGTRPSGITERNFALGIPGYVYADLYVPHRLEALAAQFYAEVERADPAAWTAFDAYRAAGGNLPKPQDASDALVRMAPHLAAFVGRLFGVEAELERQRVRTQAEDPIFRFKREFVTRKVLGGANAAKKAHAHGADAAPAPSPDEAERLAAERAAADAAAWAAASARIDALARATPGVPAPDAAAAGIPHRDEAIVARVVLHVFDLERAVVGAVTATPPRPVAAADAAAIDALAWDLGAAVPTDDAARAAFATSLLADAEAFVRAARDLPPGRALTRGWVSFRLPHPVDYENLVPVVRPQADLPELLQGPDDTLRRRDGFALTDPRYSHREVMSEVHYCLYCHERDKDSCSKGFRKKEGGYKENPLNVDLTGCPLEEKISEAHVLRRDGETLAALSVILIDNPMCPGTGHRICNDCMKGCIFQKQEPVNIPQIETGILTDVLGLPWGFEIYALLTRWNPLNIKRPVALPYNGKNVLVVGLGPAGYTLAHYLLNEGFGVVAIDGLKIEPLPTELTGADGHPPRAIRDWRDLERALDERILTGFGGVSEYGITVRWDKNFLNLIYLALARRDTLRIYGGVRFGANGTLPLDEIWKLGVDHVAIAAGAGRPTIVPMENNLIRGVRKASDFLMAIQLTGAFKRPSLANMQLRLPAIVIGGGLTGVDTTTEAFAYYVVQVEKTYERMEVLAREAGFGPLDDAALARALDYYGFDDEEKDILREFVVHGRAVKAERARAKAAGEAPNFVPMVRDWGGVSLVYRKRVQDSPAYRSNHEEVMKALEEGISIVENLSPVAAVPDRYGSVEFMRFERMKLTPEGKWKRSGELVTLPARSVFVAAGTHPNVIYEKEAPGTFVLDKWGEFFAAYKVVWHDDAGERTPHVERVDVDNVAPLSAPGFFTSYRKVVDGRPRLVSFYGDNHPTYAGNVVKAMASAKDGYGEVVSLFADELRGLRLEGQAARDASWHALVRRLDDELEARVVRVERLTPTIVEVVVRAPRAAREFQPGQFYRLQNYETHAPIVDGTRLSMEGLALTGAWADREQGLLSMIVLEMGVSSRLCAALKPGEPVIVMGPTGTPTEIPKGETVCLVGGGLGNAVFFSIAKAMRDNGNRVLYFAGYRRATDLFKREEIEASTDLVVWSVDAGDLIQPHRPQDRAFRGNIVQSINAYATGAFGPTPIALHDVTRIISIGSDRMMGAIKVARKTTLASHLRPDHHAVASINSPMQCMMKEVCAQCLQKHVDPQSGAEKEPVFTCFNQDQPMDAVDWENLATRLRMNGASERLALKWFERLVTHQPKLLGV